MVSRMAAEADPGDEPARTVPESVAVGKHAILWPKRGRRCGRPPPRACGRVRDLAAERRSGSAPGESAHAGARDRNEREELDGPPDRASSRPRGPAADPEPRRRESRRRTLDHALPSALHLATTGGTRG